MPFPLCFTTLWTRPLTPLLRAAPCRLLAFRPASHVLRVEPSPRVSLPRVRPMATAADPAVSSAAPQPPSSRTDDDERYPSSMFATSLTFSDLGVSQAAVDHLAARGITTPTHAQATIIPLLLDGLSLQSEYAEQVHAAAAVAEASGEQDDGKDGKKGDAPGDVQSERRDDAEKGDTDGNVTAPQRDPDDVNDVLMFGAETGSGKTLSYLLPYVEATTRTKLALKAIILVPSRELCAQTATFLKSYFPHAPRHLVLAGGTPPDAAAMRGVRVLIATPTALLAHLRFSQRADTSDKLIIVDEADMLLCGSFLQDVAIVLDQPGMKPFATRRNTALRARNANRLVFVGATYPHWTGEKVRSVVTWVRRRYPDVKSVQTSGLHRRNTRLQSRWRFEPAAGKRIDAVVEILARDVADGDKVMVFCGKADTARQVHDAVIGAIGPEMMEARFGGAVELHKLVDSRERVKGLVRFREAKSRVLFCTDLAARGLDLGDVTRVIEFDFSQNVVNYLHRIGRTARAGARGVTDHLYDDVSRPLAEAIREKAEVEGSVVDGVFSRRRSFRRKLKKRLRSEAAELAAEQAVDSGAEHAVDSGARVDTISEEDIDEMDEEERRRWDGDDHVDGRSR